MDGKGGDLDNIVTERLWITIKYEEIYLKDYESPREARKEINNFIHFYNYERPHQSIGYNPPASIYRLGVKHPQEWRGYFPGEVLSRVRQALAPLALDRTSPGKKK